MFESLNQDCISYIQLWVCYWLWRIGFDANTEIELGRKRKRQIADKIMGLIEICNFADMFSLLFNPNLGLCR